MRTPVQKLKLLGRFHFLTAGLIAVLACIPPIGLWYLWQWMLRLPDPDLIDPWIPKTMTIIGAVALADGLILALLLVLAGVFIRKRKNRLFCLVVAAVAIPHFPFATILGAFTVAVLMRPDVESLFYPQATLES